MSFCIARLSIAAAVGVRTANCLMSEYGTEGHVSLERVWGGTGASTVLQWGCVSTYPVLALTSEFILLSAGSDAHLSSDASRELDGNDDADLLVVTVPVHNAAQVRFLAANQDAMLIALVMEHNQLAVIDYNGKTLVDKTMNILDSHHCIGLYWLKSSEVVIVSTQSSIFLYKFDGERCCLFPIKAYNRKAQFELYLPSHELLIWRDENRRFSLASVSLKGVCRICRFHIGAFTTTNKDLDRAVSFFSIYGKPTLAFVDAVKEKLHIYVLEESSMKHRNTFSLAGSGSFTTSVIDNIIVAVGEKLKLPLLYDVLIRGVSPIVAPLPLRFVDTDEPYAGNWVQFGERYMALMCGESCKGIWTLRLHLDTIASSWGSAMSDTLIEFLSRRQHGRNAILDRLKELMLIPERLKTVGRVFDLLNAIRYDIDIHQVLEHCLSKVSDAHLERVCLVYRHSLAQHDLEPSESFILSFAALLVHQERFTQLQQLCQYHLLRDSVSLARLLLAAQHRFVPACQLALDMLHRLGAFDEILEVLLESSTVIQALLLIEAQSDYFEGKMDALAPKLLRIALESGCHETFFETFCFLRRRSDSVTVLSDKDCEHFVQRFDSLFPNKAPLLH